MKSKLRARHILSSIAAIAVAAFLSYSPTDLSGVPSDASSVPIIVLFSLILTFLLNHAISQHENIRTLTNMERSRIRRLHHLAENMGDKAFAKKIDITIAEYLDFFARNDFRFYNQTSDKFRAMTHAVYSYKPKNRRAEIIYAEMLQTARELAGTRQQVTSLLNQQISKYGWLVLLSVEAFVILAVLITRGLAQFSNVVSTVTIASILMVTLLLYETDTYRDELSDFADQYVNNIRKIEQEKGKIKKR